jgi:hypothetical protein
MGYEKQTRPTGVMECWVGARKLSGREMRPGSLVAQF